MTLEVMFLPNYSILGHNRKRFLLQLDNIRNIIFTDDANNDPFILSSQLISTSWDCLSNTNTCIEQNARLIHHLLFSSSLCTWLESKDHSNLERSFFLINFLLLS